MHIPQALSLDQNNVTLCLTHNNDLRGHKGTSPELERLWLENPRKGMLKQIQPLLLPPKKAQLTRTEA